MGRSLVTIDPTNGNPGNTTLIGSLGNNGERVASLAFGEDDSTLYAATGNGGTAAQSLFSVDPTTGDLNQLCTLHVGYGHALAYGNDALYHAVLDCTSGPCEFLIEQIDTANLPADPSHPCAGTLLAVPDLNFSEPSGLVVESVNSSVTLLMQSFSSLFRITIPGESSDADGVFLRSNAHDSKGLAINDADVISGNLAVSKVVAKIRQQGSKYLTYTIEVTNSGPDPIDNVTVTDYLPSGTALAGLSIGCTDEGSSVRCALGTVNPGEPVSTVVFVQLLCKKCSSVTNEVLVETSDIDSFEYPDDNSFFLTTSVKGKF